MLPVAGANASVDPSDTWVQFRDVVKTGVIVIRGIPNADIIINNCELQNSDSSA